MAQGSGSAGGGKAGAKSSGRVAAVRAPARVHTPPSVSSALRSDAVGADSSSSLARAVGRLNGGAPLPQSTRDRVEQSFGQPFGNVRVHTDAAGSDLARGVGAEAV